MRGLRVQKANGDRAAGCATSCWVLQLESFKTKVKGVKQCLDV